MAYDEGLVQLMRDDLADEPVTEKKMFGGLAFLREGHMLCGVHKGGAMFRVGKTHQAQALAIDGVGPMQFTGRPMAGFVETDEDTITDDHRRGELMTLALGFVKTLPPK